MADAQGSTLKHSRRGTHPAEHRSPLRHSAPARHTTAVHWPSPLATRHQMPGAPMPDAWSPEPGSRSPALRGSPPDPPLGVLHSAFSTRRTLLGAKRAAAVLVPALGVCCAGRQAARRSANAARHSAPIPGIPRSARHRASHAPPPLPGVPQLAVGVQYVALGGRQSVPVRRWSRGWFLILRNFPFSHPAMPVRTRQLRLKWRSLNLRTRPERDRVPFHRSMADG